MEETKNEKNERVKALDGLRFWAITLVVASHSGFLSQGGLGNNIFFVLSGFFAMNPFRDIEVDRIFRNKYIFKYYIKKFLRIIPVFWAYLLITFIFNGGFVIKDFNSFNNLFLNASLIKVHAHIWFLQQEVAFCIVAPFILFFIHLIRKLFEKCKISKTISYLMITILLIVAAILATKYFPRSPFKFEGNNMKNYFRLGYFLAGMATGYMFKTYESSSKKINEKNLLFRFLCNTVIISFILFCIVSSAQVLGFFNEEYKEYYIGWRNANLCVIVACITIFVLSISTKTIMNKFFSNELFVYIGKISYCIYLFHMNFLMLQGRNPFFKFILVYFVSISVCAIINKYIEEPSIKLAKKIKY